MVVLRGVNVNSLEFRPDGDNVLKAVCDGINGVVWADDVQAVDQRVTKVYGETPGLRVRVAALGMVGELL